MSSSSGRPIALTLETISLEVMDIIKSRGGNHMNLSGGEVLIFSVYQPDVDVAINRANHEVCVARIRDIFPAVMEVEGKYNGEEERSILLPTDSNNRATALGITRLLARDYSQDSYMLIDTAGAAALFDPDTGDHIRELGKLRRLTDVADIGKVKSWTKIGEHYYTTVGE